MNHILLSLLKKALQVPETETLEIFALCHPLAALLEILIPS